MNYATYKSSTMIKNHIKQHNSQKGQGKDDIGATIVEKITTFQTIIRPYIIPAIPIFLIVIMILVFVIIFLRLLR